MKYNDLLSDCNHIECPIIHNQVRHVFHPYVIRTKNRDFVQNKLKEKGVSTGIHYPTPLPFLKAYEYLRHQTSDFPISYNYSKKILSLPIYPEMSDESINYVVDIIKSCEFS